MKELTEQSREESEAAVREIARLAAGLSVRDLRRCEAEFHSLRITRGDRTGKPLSRVLIKWLNGRPNRTATLAEACRALKYRATSEEVMEAVELCASFQWLAKAWTARAHRITRPGPSPMAKYTHLTAIVDDP